ncbi:ATP-binding protein [Streptomyces sp. NPDC048577]|uniref:ATP-binding protein n=1 Tax=Streptomyces sp. NPDC048577 TaxID=3157209 RepID=UPI003420846D
MLATTPNAVGLARLHTSDILTRWGVPTAVIETAQLIVSELTTNAVQHPQEGEERVSLYSPQSPLRTFELLLEAVCGVVRISVWDCDERPPALKRVGVEATGGRGIFLVAAMSSKWGHYQVRDGPGKVVWAEVGLVPRTEVHEVERGQIPGQPSPSGRRVPRAERVDPHLLGRVLAGVRNL